jgi:hypothetical protein
MPSKKPLSAKRRMRDREIYARFLAGALPDDLRIEFKTHLYLVEQAIAAGREETAKRFADQHEVRLMQSEQLRMLFHEALAAWELSKQGSEVTKVATAADGKDAAKQRAEKTTKTDAGDPRFLSQAMSALADIRRLWKLEAPAAAPQSDSLSLREDARFYGNNAHDLAAQAAAASTADLDFPSPV